MRREPVRARILVVDDDPSTRHSVATVLRAEGFEVSTAHDGPSALTEARRALPDVVITDLSMPAMDGMQLCRHLRELDPDVTIIVVTGHAETSYAVASLRAGVEDFLTKPLDLDTLVHRLERTLERRQAKVALAMLMEQMRSTNERLVLSSIREQENAEVAELQRAQLSALLEKLSDGVIIAEPGGRVVMANRAAQEVLHRGGPITDVRELHQLDILRPDGTSCPVADRPLPRALRGEVFEHCEILLRVRGSGDDVRRLVTSGTSVRGVDGSIALAIVVFRDVSELRKLERQRAEFIGLVTHDLRGPLNSILMSATLLKNMTQAKEVFDPAPMIDRLTRNAQRMSGMITELVESAALESKRVELLKEPCDLREIVSRVVEDLDDASRQRIVLESAAAPARALAEPSKIERAIANLVTNALKYSPENAAVRITLGRRAEEIVLEVADHGIGITEAQQRRLFERYYRAPNGKHMVGLGLGLYITGLLVEAHGGRMEVASEVGKGSVFTMFLPALGA